MGFRFRSKMGALAGRIPAAQPPAAPPKDPVYTVFADGRPPVYAEPQPAPQPTPQPAAPQPSTPAAPAWQNMDPASFGLRRGGFGRILSALRQQNIPWAQPQAQQPQPRGLGRRARRFRGLWGF